MTFNTGRIEDVRDYLTGAWLRGEIDIQTLIELGYKLGYSDCNNDVNSEEYQELEIKQAA